MTWDIKRSPRISLFTACIDYRAVQHKKVRIGPWIELFGSITVTDY